MTQGYAGDPNAVAGSSGSVAGSTSAAEQQQQEGIDNSTGLTNAWNQIIGHGAAIVGPNTAAYNQQLGAAQGYGAGFMAAGNQYQQAAPSIYNPYAAQSQAGIFGNIGREKNLADYYQSIMTGSGPTAAQSQYQMSQDAAIQAQMAMARSARGGAASQAGAQRQATQAAGAQLNQAAAQSAIIRAQEAQQAAQAQAGVYGNIGSQTQAQYALEQQAAAQQAQIAQTNQQQINAMRMGLYNLGVSEQGQALGTLGQYTNESLAAQGVNLSGLTGTSGGQSAGATALGAAEAAAMLASDKRLKYSSDDEGIMSDPNAKMQAYQEGLQAGSQGGGGGYGPYGGGGQGPYGGGGGAGGYGYQGTNTGQNPYGNYGPGNWSGPPGSGTNPYGFTNYSPTNPPSGYTWDGHTYVPTNLPGGGLDVGVQNYLNSQNQPGRGALAPAPSAVRMVAPSVSGPMRTQVAGPAAAPSTAAMAPRGIAPLSAMQSQPAAAPAAMAQPSVPKPPVAQQPAQVRPMGVPPVQAAAGGLMSDEFEKAAARNESMYRQNLAAASAPPSLQTAATPTTDIGTSLTNFAQAYKKANPSPAAPASAPTGAAPTGAAPTGSGLDPNSDAGAADIASADQAAGVPAGLSSDKRAKMGVRRTLADEFMDHLHPASYLYKNPGDEPRPVPTGGRYLGVMAQDMQQIPELGNQLIMQTPRGKMVAPKAALSAALAGIGRLNERVKLLESQRHGGK